MDLYSLFVNKNFSDYADGNNTIKLQTDINLDDAGYSSDYWLDLSSTGYTFDANGHKIIYSHYLYIKNPGDTDYKTYQSTE